MPSFNLQTTLKYIGLLAASAAVTAIVSGIEELAKSGQLGAYGTYALIFAAILAKGAAYLHVTAPKDQIIKEAVKESPQAQEIVAQKIAEKKAS